ncbi:MAG: efflux RND transporter permease subunit, partial [Bifidobacteriaceae bacterium]|nr:efflux RND transporter permease subunit [Bifidobacteriaceae bacterium]
MRWLSSPGGPTVFRLTALSLRHRAVVALVSLAILVGGVMSMTGLKQELIPDIGLPKALVSATSSGVPGELMENQLADVLEGAIETVPGIESIETTSIDSVFFSIVEFGYDANKDAVNQKLTTSIGRIARQLPDEVVTNVITGSMN